MANAVGLDSRLRRRDEESNASSFTASSSFLYDNDIERHLLFDQVTKLNGITCGLTTSLRTSYKGRNAGTGIMFTIRPSKNIELLTLELPTYENFANGSNPSEKEIISQPYPSLFWQDYVLSTVKALNQSKQR